LVDIHGEEVPHRNHHHSLSIHMQTYRKLDILYSRERSYKKGIIKNYKEKRATTCGIS
jgi:hypothetical protein